MDEQERNAISCYECSAISDEREPKDFDECPSCGSDATVAVMVTPCPVAPDGSLKSGRTKTGRMCLDENHHWGRGDHVINPNEE